MRNWPKFTTMMKNNDFGLTANVVCGLAEIVIQQNKKLSEVYYDDEE